MTIERYSYGISEKAKNVNWYVKLKRKKVAFENFLGLWNSLGWISMVINIICLEADECHGIELTPLRWKISLYIIWSWLISIFIFILYVKLTEQIDD